MNVFKVKENDDTPTPLKFGLANIRSFCEAIRVFPELLGNGEEKLIQGDLSKECKHSGDSHGLCRRRWKL